MENYYPIEFDNNGSSFTITNNGTAPAPCLITFIPQVDFITLSITGLSDEPIEVSGIRANDVLVIDGENRQVLLNDQDYFSHYNGWEFPKLQPGVNEIRIPSGSLANIQIEYNARYI